MVCEILDKINYINFDKSVRKFYSNNKETRVTFDIGSYWIDGIIESQEQKSHLLVGRYSSLGQRIVFEIGLNHNYKRVSTYPFYKSVKQEYTEVNNNKSDINHYQIVIGNDVWIGCDTIIMGGSYVSNGAIIGAGAVVAGYIPPYAIAVGNPAKVIKYRFTKDIIDKLQRIKWWYWDNDKINENLLLMNNPEEFVNKYYIDNISIEKNNDVILELQNFKKRGYRLYYFVVDYKEKILPVWKEVIGQYLYQCSIDNRVALILGLSNNINCRDKIQCINNMIHEKGEEAPLILSHYGGGFCQRL